MYKFKIKQVSNNIAVVEVREGNSIVFTKNFDVTPELSLESIRKFCFGQVEKIEHKKKKSNYFAQYEGEEFNLDNKKITN